MALIWIQCDRVYCGQLFEVDEILQAKQTVCPCCTTAFLSAEVDPPEAMSAAMMVEAAGKAQPGRRRKKRVKTL